MFVNARRAYMMRARHMMAMSGLIAAVVWAAGTYVGAQEKPAAPAKPAAAKPAAGAMSAVVARGKHLVESSGCHDCHTPMKMGDNGPEPDMARMLSGHPAEVVISGPPQLSGPWMAATNNTFTAWAGPWG